MKIAVTGARGSQQAPVVEALLARGHQVAALRRKPPSESASEPSQLQWVTGDLRRPEGLADLLAGAEGLSFHLPVASAPWPVEPLLTAAKGAGVKRVVFNASSQVPPPGDSSPSRKAVDALHAHGFDAVVWQPTLYLENLLLPFLLADLKDGWLRYPLAASGFGVAWVASADLGALTAAAFATSATGSYAAAGPEALDGNGLAAALGRGLGKEIRFEQLAPAAFGAKLTPLLGEQAAAGVRDMYAAVGQLPQQFARWLAPDLSPTRAAFEVTPTSAEQWAAKVLRPALAG